MQPCRVSKSERVESRAPGNRLLGRPPRPRVPRFHPTRVQEPRSRTRPKHCWKFPEQGPELDRQHTMQGAHISLACRRLGQAIIATTTDVDVARIVHDTLNLSMIVETSLLRGAVCLQRKVVPSESKSDTTPRPSFGSGIASSDGLLFSYSLPSFSCWILLLSSKLKIRAKIYSISCVLPFQQLYYSSTNDTNSVTLLDVRKCVKVGSLFNS